MVDPASTRQSRPSETALLAITDVLEKDPSPHVRGFVLRRISESRWRNLPGELGPAVLANARNPTGLEGEDSVGRVLLKRDALQALGKLEHPEGHAWLLAELGKPGLDPNTMSGFTLGAAHIGNSVALAGLRAAVLGQRKRGPEAFREAVGALGAFPSAEVLPIVREVLAEDDGNGEVAHAILSHMKDNPALLSTPELAGFVGDFVTARSAWGDDVRSRALHLLDRVHDARRTQGAGDRSPPATPARASRDRPADAEVLRGQHGPREGHRGQARP